MNDRDRAQQAYDRAASKLRKLGADVEEFDMDNFLEEDIWKMEKDLQERITWRQEGCECGASMAGGVGPHSDWCPKYNKTGG